MIPKDSKVWNKSTDSLTAITYPVIFHSIPFVPGYPEDITLSVIVQGENLNISEYTPYIPDFYGTFLGFLNLSNMILQFFIYRTRNILICHKCLTDIPSILEISLRYPHFCIIGYPDRLSIQKLWSDFEEFYRISEDFKEFLKE